MSDNVLSKGLKNIKYSFLAQAIILIIGILKTLIVPSVMSVQSYAFWQMYLFYIGYIGFFYLGYNDGILLKYGKYEYVDLPFQKLRSSMMFYILMLTVFSVIVFIISMNIPEKEKSFVMMIIALSILMYGLYGVFIYVFLITNQIKRHSFFTAIDSISTLVGILLMLIIRQKDFHILIYFVFILKLISVIVMAVMCKEFFIGKRASMKNGFIEFIDNIKVGIILMLAQIVSMLVTGIGRIFIEYSGKISEYAYYSFGMTIVNIVMVGIMAVSTVMYPTLGRIDSKKLPTYFNKIYKYLTHFSALSLLLYFPAYIFVRLFFAKYAPMLDYFAVFFAMMTWQAKLNIFNNSYYKVLRMEKKMLKINIYGVIFFCISTVLVQVTLGNYIQNKILIIAYITYFTMIFIEIYAEIVLRKALNLKLDKQVLVNILINIIFLVTSFISNVYAGFALYVIFTTCYLFINKKDIFKDILYLKSKDE